MIITVTEEDIADGIFELRTKKWYTIIHFNYDNGHTLFAHWLIAPFIGAWFWWDKHRWKIEQWMRWRISDIPGGYSCALWSYGLRPLKKWTWRRTRPHSLSDEYKRVEEGFLKAMKDAEEARRAAELSVITNYTHNLPPE
jgi:hypothetical protein